MKSLLMTLAFIFALPSANAEIRESGGFRTPLGVQVDFVSIGRGADRVAKQKVHSLIQALMLDAKIAFVDDKPWGLEGESTVCVQFFDFDELLKFYNEVGAVIGSNSLVKHKTVMSCDPDFKVDPRE